MKREILHKVIYDYASSYNEETADSVIERNGGVEETYSKIINRIHLAGSRCPASPEVRRRINIETGYCKESCDNSNCRACFKRIMLHIEGETYFIRI